MNSYWENHLPPSICTSRSAVTSCATYRQVLDGLLQYSTKVEFISSEMRNVPLRDPVHPCLWNVPFSHHPPKSWFCRSYESDNKPLFIEVIRTVPTFSLTLYHSVEDGKECRLCLNNILNYATEWQQTMLFFRWDDRSVCDKVCWNFVEAMPSSGTVPKVMFCKIALGLIGLREFEVS